MPETLTPNQRKFGNLNLPALPLGQSKRWEGDGCSDFDKEQQQDFVNRLVKLPLEQLRNRQTLMVSMVNQADHKLRVQTMNDYERNLVEQAISDGLAMQDLLFSAVWIKTEPK